MNFRKYLCILIKPTDSCNLRCRYCFQQHKGYEKNKLSVDTLQNFCKITFPYYDEIKITWHGGEPTLVGLDSFKEYFEIVEKQASKQNVKLDHTMQTNGTLIDEAFAKFLGEKRVRVGLSFDGLANDELRNSTKQVLETKNLLDKYKIFSGMLTVVSGVNVRILYENYEYMKHMNINFKLSHYDDINSPDDNLRMDLDVYLENMKNLFDVWIDDQNCNLVLEPFNRMVLDYFRGYSNLCSHSSCLRYWACLNPNGDITPCDRAFPDEYIYGNVNSLSDFRQIYDSLGYLKLIKGANLRREKCKKECDLYDYCEGGCNHEAILSSGLENNGGFACKAFRELFTYIRSVIDERDYFNNFKKIKNPALLKEVTKFMQTRTQ